MLAGHASILTINYDQYDSFVTIVRDVLAVKNIMYNSILHIILYTKSCSYLVHVYEQNFVDSMITKSDDIIDLVTCLMLELLLYVQCTCSIII